MAEQSLDGSLLKIAGSAISSAVGVTVGWLAGGSSQMAIALSTSLAVLGGIGALAFSVLYRRTLGVLGSGGARKGSPARAAYDALRESLAGDNVAARIYSSRLRAFLDGIERFLGDAGMADRTLFPRAFGLHTPTPLWTMPAFDRCLWLALIYPFATIILIWMISGHAGPAETALGLPAGVSGWRRVAAAPFGAVAAIAVWWSYRAQHKVNTLAWGAFAATVAAVLAGAGAIVVNGAFAVAVAVAVAGSFAVPAAFPYAGVFAVVFAVAFAVTFVGAVASAYAIASAFSDTGSVLVILAIAFLVFAVAVAVVSIFAFVFVVVGVVAWVINVLADARRQQGILHAFLVVAMIASCIGAPAVLTSRSYFDPSGPLLLFLGLLTLINAPFDWASLGLTRALLRRGLESGGWWPYLLALVDAALAAVIITLLAMVMVVSVQAFDTVRVHSGGKPVLPLQPLFDGIASHPREPEYWWLYALLISSMIPSFINLMIGGAAFLHGVPGLRSLLLGFLPAGKAVPPFDRAWIALVLTAQIFLGALLGIAAQALLAIGIIGYAMPWLGLRVLDIARDVADFNLPERVWVLVIG
jgi:hypothetical protein